MNRLVLMLLLVLFGGTASWAQDAETEADSESQETSATTPEGDEVTDEEIEELLDLDEEYTELEDDFDPTEEVRFEQSIPFPTDI